MKLAIDDMFDLKIGEYLKDVHRYIKDECELLSEEIDDGHHYRIYENKKQGTYVFTIEVTLGQAAIFAELTIRNYEELLENEMQEMRDAWANGRDEEWMLSRAKIYVRDEVLANGSPSFCNRWHH